MWAVPLWPCMIISFMKRIHSHSPQKKKNLKLMVSKNQKTKQENRNNGKVI